MVIMLAAIILTSVLTLAVVIYITFQNRILARSVEEAINDAIREWEDSMEDKNDDLTRYLKSPSVDYMNSFEEDEDEEDDETISYPHIRNLSNDDIRSILDEFDKALPYLEENDTQKENTSNETDQQDSTLLSE